MSATCEQVIDARLADRLADIRALYHATNGSATPNDIQALYDFDIVSFDGTVSAEDAEQALDEYGLGLYGNDEDDDDVYHVTLELSTGGPADRFDFYPSASGSAIARIVYHYVDWFDHAEREIMNPDDVQLLTDVYGEYIAAMQDEYRAAR